ncbi:MAG TPA: ABC transporter permease [Chloroflexota bacterium]|nr:ABC transporter permease [Chloroflexota bacterium]
MSIASNTIAANPAVPRTIAAPRPRVGMSIGQSVGTAFEAVAANRLRSLLTMLGIVIGVGAVIIMVALGNGATANVAQRLQGLGTNMLTITPGSQRGPGSVAAGAGSNRTLTEANATAISSQVAGLNGVSPVLNVNVQAVSSSSNWSTQVQGVYPVYQPIENWQTQAGSLLTDQDEQQGSQVAVIGQTVLDNLFGNGNAGSGNASAAIGQTVRLNKIPFTVEGVLASKSDQQDNVILVPYASAHLRLNDQTYVNQIVVQVADASQMTSAQSQITTLLEQQHRITTGKDDFTVRNLNSIVQTAQGVTQTMTMLLSGVAAVSLLVGGIGIMNIMLVSVTERTREIGIRSAIGARRGDILTQFLIEALALSALGGIVGIVLGMAGSFGISHFAGWSTVVSPISIVMAFGFAAAVGIFFGYYPARKASQLDPIQALRYE